MEISIKKYVTFSEIEKSILKSPIYEWGNFFPSREEFISERNRLSDLGEIDREKNGYFIFERIQATSVFHKTGCYSVERNILIYEGGYEYSSAQDANIGKADIYKIKTFHFFEDGREMSDTEYHFLSSTMIDEQGNKYTYTGRGNVYKQ